MIDTEDTATLAMPLNADSPGTETPAPVAEEDYQDLCPELTVEQIVAAYQKELRDEKINNWNKGDLAISITARAKKMKETAPARDLVAEFLLATGEDAKTFANNRWIARCYPHGPKRSYGVTWTHYRICANTTNPDLWLDRAVKETMSTRKLIDEIETDKNNTRVAVGIPCDCGCKVEVPKESPIYLGGSITGGRRKFFASAHCLIRFIGNIVPAEATEAPVTVVIGGTNETVPYQEVDNQTVSLPAATIPFADML